MPYWQLFYHLVWATKDRSSLLSPEVEQIVHGFLRSKAIGLEGTVFALNGTHDHVHMVVAIPPKIAVATFVGQVKGVASARFNQSGRGGVPLYWQDEYGAFSFDAKRLPNYIRYVERQKDHHARGDTIPVLERTTGGATGLMRETRATYDLPDDDWRQELNALGVEDDRTFGLKKGGNQ